MKITKQHYQIMQSAINSVDTPERRQTYFAQCTSLRGYQWYLLKVAGLSPFICDEIYKYANDDHIQTVLNKVVKL